MKRNQPYQIGDRVSMQYVADRYPGTVVDVQRGGRTLIVRQDTALPAPDAEPMSNKWTITENPDGGTETFTLRNDGSYRARHVSSPFLTNGWSHYYSYEF
ncbi:MAG: hypothetical protein LC650_03935 [Actinobacteria bacterium]|nr:hypothetical protein [Actinomycetota bacterium]